MYQFCIHFSFMRIGWLWLNNRQLANANERLNSTINSWTQCGLAKNVSDGSQVSCPPAFSNNFNLRTNLVYSEMKGNNHEL